MRKSILITSLVVTLLAASCQQTTKREADILTETAKQTDLLIGSWVEPNPINENEVQGVKINEDGTAESINMATLVYKKWWQENGKLTLVFESIGNGTTSVDTTTFEIIKLNEKALEIKAANYTTSYKRQ